MQALNSKFTAFSPKLAATYHIVPDTKAKYM